MRAAASHSASSPPRERVLTIPLAVFLASVAGILVWGWWRPVPGPGEAIVQLADGDLDGDERRAVLQALLERGAASDRITHRWGAMLAAVALERRDSFDALLGALSGPGPGMQLPPNDELDFLDLGDPLLHNVLLALWAEARGDRPAALLRWQQTDAQCRLMVRPVAAALADEGIRRCKQG